MRGDLRSAVVIAIAGAVLALAFHTKAQTPAGQLGQVAYIKASNPGMSDHLGCGGALDGHAGIGIAISGDGNTMAVGAPHESSNASGVNGNQANDNAYSSGAVYVYTRTANGPWAQQAYIKASNPGDADDFGHVVSLSADGNTLAVSAYYESSGARGVNGDQKDESTPQAGAAYVFTRAGGQWSQQAYVKASNTGEAGVGDNFGDGDQFGFALALSDDGNVLAVGAYDEGGSSRVVDGPQDTMRGGSGAVYIFARTGGAWRQANYLKAANAEQGDSLGVSVAISDDGNTMASGAELEDGGATGINGRSDEAAPDSGAVYLFTRTGTAWAQQAYVKSSNSDAYDEFGSSVALSRDGKTMVVGARGEDSNARGINGNQNDNSVQESGAAYSFSY